MMADYMIDFYITMIKAQILTIDDVPESRKIELLEQLEVSK